MLTSLTPPAGTTTFARVPVIAIVPDLYFATRIAATAKAAGVALELVTPQRAAARLAAADVSLVLLELGSRDALALVTALKKAQPTVPVVGFGAHVEAALLRDARAAGADAVLPRSQFVGKLPALLEQGLAALAPGGREDLRL